MARASIPTLLALDRYAKIMGITPPHFNQGTSAIIFPVDQHCRDIWYQHQWQNADHVSREDLALEIANAEQDIADLMGYWPGPKWIAQEAHPYPQHYRPEAYGVGGMNTRLQYKTINTNYAKVILPGIRDVAEISLGEGVDYDTPDGDAYDEEATVDVVGVTQTTNVCEIKVYFAGHGGDPEWEIRPARTATLVAGTYTATFWAWQLIDPDYWEELPIDGFGAVDLDDAVYVTTVDVYREYTAVSVASATFYWEPGPRLLGTCSICGGSGCAVCQLTSQDGCLHIRDAERGIVVAAPATYDEDSGAWESAAWAQCRDPDQIKIYYYAGALDNRWLRCATCEPLSDWWAQTIAYLATARLERPFCNCGNSAALAEHLRTDLALVGETSRNVPFELLGNPLGTRRGEVMAWQRISRIARGQKRGAGAI